MTSWLSVFFEFHINSQVWSLLFFNWILPLKFLSGVFKTAQLLVLTVVIVWYLHLQLPVSMQPVPITTNIVSSNPANCEMYSIQYYVIKFVCDLRHVGGSPVSSINKTDHNDISEILLKVALNAITLTIYIIVMPLMCTLFVYIPCICLQPFGVKLSIE
jgi:hypothetical protein